MAISLVCLLAVAGVASGMAGAPASVWAGLAAAALAGLAVMAATWWGSGDLRAALAR
jgi:hypothetical protein